MGCGVQQAGIERKDEEKEGGSADLQEFLGADSHLQGNITQSCCSRDVARTL